MNQGAVNRCAYCGYSIYADAFGTWRHSTSGRRACRQSVAPGRLAAPRAHAPHDPRSGVSPCAGVGRVTVIPPDGGTLAGRGGEQSGAAAPPWLREVIQWRVVRRFKPELAAAMLAVIELGDRAAVYCAARTVGAA